MEHNKRKKLKSKGYNVGSFSEILKLSPSESDYVKFKLFLSRSIRENRERKGLTQQSFAKLIKSSQSRVAKMESCDSSVTIDLLIKSHLGLGISIIDLVAKHESEYNKKQQLEVGQVNAFSTDISTGEYATQRQLIPNSSESNIESVPMH